MVRKAFFIAMAAMAFQAMVDEPNIFRDPEDGELDASAWLLDKKGFLPVPIIVTEPAIGYGGGASLLWFRESLGERRAQGRLTPPDIFGAALAATENGTALAAAFGMVTFADEYWRWKGGVGRPDINLDFYGAGGELGTGERQIAYNLEGWGSTQSLMRRLGESENFVGARWMYLDLDASFAGDHPAPALAERSRSITSSGLGLFFEHDSRDNFFTPARGWKGYLEAMFYSPDFGGDGNYELYRAQVFAYLPWKNFVLGGRVDTRAASGDVPFYQLPFIEMRGIPVARYQDEKVGLVEAELRWNFTARWALIGFLGSGRTWGSSTGFSAGDTVSAWGAGLRRLVARRLGIYMGVDLARGPEETAIYIQAGSAWR